jgi:hypothetical protein
MTLEIAFLLLLLISMVYLFLTEKLPVHLTAFLGLAILILTGYLNAEEAFTGFAASFWDATSGLRPGRVVERPRIWRNDLGCFSRRAKGWGSNQRTRHPSVYGVCRKFARSKGCGASPW